MAKREDGAVTPRLDSWKEIAAFLGRGVRTVQRWEREEGLPVHRLAHAKRGTVYAERTELTAWWDSRRLTENAATPANAAVATPQNEHRIERVTETSAATFWPALSFDGRSAVYVSDAGHDGESPQVWLQHVGGAAAQLTSGMRDCAEPTFSADGTRIVFTARGDSTRNVFEVPAVGGPPRVVRRGAWNARYSPDGKWLAYFPIEPRDTVRLVSCASGEERALTPGLVDIVFATWSDDSRHLLVIAHLNPSVDLDCWIVPIDGGTPIDTGVMTRARHQGSVVFAMSAAWAGDSIFYSAADRQGVHVWRQRLSPATREAVGAPELMSRGGDFVFFPSAAGGRLSFVATHADVNLWSVAIDAATGTAYGPLRRLTRGAGIVSHLTLSQDGRTLAYFAVGLRGPELRVRNLENGADTPVYGPANANRGFPVISPSGDHMAYGAMVPGPPVQRPLFISNIDGGNARTVRDDCGGRPRQWIDEQTLLVETFGSGLNAFLALDARDGTQRPLLSAAARRVSNPRISPGGRWLAFDAMRPGGSPQVAIAPLDQVAPIPEPAWTVIPESASHPFWSRDGCWLYYLETFPSAEIRSRVLARRFDPSTGRLSSEATEVLTLREMIVPAQITGTAPVVAPDQMIFVLGDYRGDVWIRDA
jgi:Tol biopolymer transport system component